MATEEPGLGGNLGGSGRYYGGSNARQQRQLATAQQLTAATAFNMHMLRNKSNAI